MEPFENDESDDDSNDSSTSQNSDGSDFSFDPDELADDLDELEILSEYSTGNEMDVNSISQSHLGQGGFTSISSNDLIRISAITNYIRINRHTWIIWFPWLSLYVLAQSGKTLDDLPQQRHMNSQHQHHNLLIN
ncbi:unnamed protein product [Rotaria magnacalcarata]|uniref:Uncharacterized protein n=1 Tax=Rotaria magnacalcarata TaxID=392030 RepID=A0A8S2KAA1_9BILA|nr:unnamed protein product [Rotaria magnacalcarata]